MPYKDRETQLEAQRKAYYKKREYYRKLQKKRRDDTKTWFREEILVNLKCIKCSESHPSCLDFHHIDPLIKEEGISVMLRKSRTKEAILAEVSKCEVLCANCHRKHHYEERIVAARTRFERAIEGLESSALDQTKLPGQ